MVFLIPLKGKERTKKGELTSLGSKRKVNIFRANLALDHILLCIGLFFDQDDCGGQIVDGTQQFTDGSIRG